MKKAFDQNVSRARPRLRLGELVAAVEEGAREVAPPAAPAPETTAKAQAPEPPQAALGKAVKARAAQAKAPRPSAAQAVQQALSARPPQSTPPLAREAEAMVAKATAAVLGAAEASYDAPERADEPVDQAEAPVAHMGPPAELVEVQTPAPQVQKELMDPPEVRRERLRERLKAVRENPKPEPLPPTVAEAGVLAVERIATLQTELHQVKALNLALTQDLEGARRQAEKATEEARLRMDESRRLAQEMDGRVKLLADLERELAALEGERDEAMLALQETRQGLTAADEDKAALKEEIARRDASLQESLAEEERLCAELEMAREQTDGLRRSVMALTTERDTLARQVSELTRERAELLEARKALEAVHRALSHATAR